MIFCLKVPFFLPFVEKINFKKMKIMVFWLHFIHIYIVEYKQKEMLRKEAFL